MSKSFALGKATVVCGALVTVAAVSLGLAMAGKLPSNGSTEAPSVDVVRAQMTADGAGEPTDAATEVEAAPTMGGLAPVGGVDDSILDLPYADPLAPVLPYRENPFQVVTEPGGTTPKGPGYAMGHKLVRVPRTGLWMPEDEAELYERMKRLNLSYYQAMADANFGASFSWSRNSFPRPRSVMQPAPVSALPLLVQPASFTAPGLGAIGPIQPGDGTGDATGPRPGVEAQPVDTVGPRVQPKVNPARIRRVAGIVHDGTALAIVEIDNGGTVARVRVQAGETFSVGQEEYKVRAIGTDEIVLVQVETSEEVRVPLRGRAANE